MATQIDKEACREAYNQVRDDNTDTNWAVFKYEGSMILPGGTGADYEDFKGLCTDDARLFAFVRITMGDAMSKRAKFTLITWIGENISGLQRAKVSTDKALVKEIVQVRNWVGSHGENVACHCGCREWSCNGPLGALLGYRVSHTI